MTFTAAVLTASDGVSAGTRADDSGELLVRKLDEAGFRVTHHVVVPDVLERIAEAIRDLSTQVRLVITTGGTGLGPRDVTPEATRSVIDRETPGLAHLMLAAGIEKTPMAALSRAVCGAVGSTLVVNLPGSPRAVEENFDAVLPVLSHALDLLAGHTEHS